MGHLDILVITVYLPPIVAGPDGEERDGLRSSLSQCAFASAVEWPGACVMLGDFNAAVGEFPEVQRLFAMGWRSVDGLSQTCNQYEVGPTYRESVRHEAILVCPFLVSKFQRAGTIQTHLFIHCGQNSP